MLDWNLLESLLVIATTCSSITVILIQKTKKFCRTGNCIILYGLVVNMIIGYLFCQTFSDVDYMKSLWVGLFSFLGADTIYKGLEGKLKSYTELKGKNTSNSQKTDTSNQKDMPLTVGKEDNTKEDATSESVSMIQENTTDTKNDVIGEIYYE